MTDIVERLRAWVYTDSLYATAREAADEIERLRQVSSQENMTDAERDVLREVCRVYADADDVKSNEISYVIDLLLARFVPAANSTPDNRTGCGESRTGSVDAKVVEDVAKCTVKSKKCPERERVAAGESKPVAWVAFATDGSESRYVSASQEQARSVADDYNWCIAPLFAGLDNEEREAVNDAIYLCGATAGLAEEQGNATAWATCAATLRALLERLGGAT